ncbi:MAG: precorrin-2 C(20)-methyltransferase [Acidimicrobiales bacterium]
MGSGERRREGGRVTGVGVGPGDPGLVTFQAAGVLAAADRVACPTLSAGTMGRAESVVRAVLSGGPDGGRPGAGPLDGGRPASGRPSGGPPRIERVVFPMSARPGDPGAYEQAAALIARWCDEGDRVAFATLGDPAIYSTFTDLATALRTLRPALEITTVPGITAFQALAAHAGRTLVSGTQSLVLTTALAGPGGVVAALGLGRVPMAGGQERAQHGAQHGQERGQDVGLAPAVVVYKGGQHLGQVSAALADEGRLDGAVLGELIGLPGERLLPLAQAGQSASYLATVIVPAGCTGPAGCTVPAGPA